MIEQVLGHEIRFVVKRFRRVTEVKAEVTGKSKGGKHGQEEEKPAQRGSRRMAEGSLFHQAATGARAW